MKVAAQRWIAIMVGVIAPLVAAVALDGYAKWSKETAAQAFLDKSAGEMFDRLEGRLISIEAALIEVSKSGVRECSLLDINNMRQAVYRNSRIKEVAVLDKSGIVLCTHLGIGGQHRILSKEIGSRQPSLSFSLIQMADRDGGMLRVRWNSNDGYSVAALVPVDQLLPDTAVVFGKAKVHLHLKLADGTPIINGDVAIDASTHSKLDLESERISNRFPYRVQLDVERAAVLADNSEVAIASWVAISCAIIALLLAAWFARRHGPDPIAELDEAISRGDFIPYYQPIIDITSGRLRGCEVLVRRRLPNGHIQSPTAFIAQIEKNGLAVPMTRRLMKVVRDEIGPHYAIRPRLRASFNLVADHFNDETIIEDVKQIFDESLLRLNQLVFEVTERDPLNDLDSARRVIAGLQALGIRIALDDVGTGHAGLSYILKLGVDSLKIDKLFIDAIEVERTTATIIETIVGLAATMHMDVVAEGVENFEQVEYLRQKGINAAQGYVFAPPLPGPSFLALVEAMEPVSSFVGVQKGRDSGKIRPLSRAFG